ncbi:hypothetical protein BH18CHL2_BH18CHL2_08970 [soil metagenome]
MDVLRAAALIGGCALLFWQYDGAAADWLFALGIASASVAAIRARSWSELAWPQPLVVLFFAATVAATAAAGGSAIALGITAHAVLTSLAFASMVRRGDRTRRLVQLAVTVAAAITAATVVLGYAARQRAWTALTFLSDETLRSRGLFKDADLAGAFLAVTYPLAAAYVVRWTRWRLALLLLVTAIFGAGVVASSSPPALIVFAVGLAGVVVAVLRLGERRLLAGFVVGCAAAALLLVRAGIDVDAVKRHELRAHENADRLAVWGFALRMFGDSPLGTGAGSFASRAPEYFTLTPEGPIGTQAANSDAAEDQPGFHGRWIMQSAAPTLRPGEISEPLDIVFRNTGTKSWTSGTSDQVRLGLSGGGLVLRNGAETVAAIASFVDLSGTSLAVGWPAPDRVATQSPEVVAPGFTSKFSFRVRGPETPGTYLLYLRPVVEDVTWLEDYGVFMQITVQGQAVGPVPAAPPPDGSTTRPPQPPSTYAIPSGARRVASSAELVAALELTGPIDIVLADGTYDNPVAFDNASGHRLYAARLGGAVLRAGIVFGGDGGLVRGLSFDVATPAKTFQNGVVNVRGPTAIGTRILDTSFNGRRVVASAIVARQVNGLVVQRVRIRDFRDYGLLAQGDEAGVAGVPLLAEDLDVAGIARDAPGAFRAETCVSLASAANVRRALLRSCARTGLWTGADNLGSLIEDVDVDDARVGISIDSGTSNATFRGLRMGPRVVKGIETSAAAMAPAPDALRMPVTASAHSLYLRVLVESGLIGLIALLAYLAALVVIAARGVSRMSWEWVLALGLVIVCGVAVDMLRSRELWVYAGVVAAMAGASRAAEPRQRATVEGVVAGEETKTRSPYFLNVSGGRGGSRNRSDRRGPPEQ